jgi:putative transposase
MPDDDFFFIKKLEASELKRIKELEEENAKLKRMYANLALDLETARYIIEKKL